MINKLVANIKKTGAPIVVGLDPMLSYVPEQVQKKEFAEYGETLEGAAEAIWQFNKEIVDKTYDLIPAVKPQIAMYEQFGIPGLQAFKKTVDYCKEKGLVVIGDIKRGDIGSTSAAYAVGHLGRVQVGSKSYVPFDEEFATVNPYHGSDGVKPFIEVCKEEKKVLSTTIIYSPVTGVAADLSEAPDPGFAEGMMGEGMVVTPTEACVYAPADGEVAFVFETKHAIGFATESGMEMLLHMGIDTVKLKGEGFEVLVTDGQKVKKGDLLMKLDIPYLKENAPSLCSPVLCTELEDNQRIHVLAHGEVKAGDPLYAVETVE